MADALTHCRDDTGRFDPHAVGHRDRVRAIAKVGIGIIEADGDMPQPDLTGAWVAHFNFLEPKDFGTTGFVKTYDLGHAFISPISVQIALRRYTWTGM